MWDLLAGILRKQGAPGIGDFLSAGIAAEVFGVQLRAGPSGLIRILDQSERRL